MGDEQTAAAVTPDGAAAAASEASTLAVEGLPVDTLREAIPFLRRPFMPEAVKFKVQTVFKEAKGCIVVAYIDARLVIERLNLVCPDAWAARYEPVEGKPNLMWCHLSVWSPLDRCDSLTRADVGEGQGMSDGQKYKACVSDSLKRAAVHFGIGVSVYALPQITLYANQPHVEKRKTAKGETLALTDLGHRKLREGYGKWLEEHGARLFGRPLDHGDVEGATFDEDEPEPEGFTPEAPAALDDDRAHALKAEIAAAYDGVDKAKHPPAKFRAQLDGVLHSHAEMERFRDWLRSEAAGETVAT